LFDARTGERRGKERQEKRKKNSFMSVSVKQSKGRQTLQHFMKGAPFPSVSL
ncbi:hypothetical protein QQF64_034714, partial [Cirrhinus molitorella]